MNLQVGQRVYNHGDMANAPHFGIITAVVTDRWGTQVTIKPDADSDRQGEYTVPICIFSPRFEGHSGTRLVTKDAYDEYRAAVAHHGLTGD